MTFLTPDILEKGGIFAIAITLIWLIRELMLMKKTPLNGTARQVLYELQQINQNHLNELCQEVRNGNKEIVEAINRGNQKVIEMLGRIEGRLSK